MDEHDNSGFALHNHKGEILQYFTSKCDSHVKIGCVPYVCLISAIFAYFKTYKISRSSAIVRVTRRSHIEHIYCHKIKIFEFSLTFKFALVSVSL